MLTQVCKICFQWSFLGSFFLTWWLTWMWIVLTSSFKLFNFSVLRNLCLQIICVNNNNNNTVLTQTAEQICSRHIWSLSCGTCESVILICLCRWLPVVRPVARRPEITILSAEPLASTSWFPGAAGGFPPPPPPAAQIWGPTIPPTIQVTPPVWTWRCYCLSDGWMDR